MYLIAVFRSLTDTHAFCELLNSIGVRARVEGTPRKADLSCGLCVRFSKDGFREAEEFIKRRGFASFVGMFEVSKDKVSPYKIDLI